MKKTFFILLTLFLIITIKSEDQKFIDANNYYAQGKFQEAINAYNLIDSKNVSILYNLGNSYYKLSNFIEAIAYWQKAKKEITSPHDLYLIDHNIDLALEKLNIKNEISVSDKIYNTLSNFSLYFSLFYLQIIFLIIWSLIVFYCFGFIKVKKNKVTLLVFLAIIILILFYLNHSFYFKKRAIVKSDNAILYAGPGEDYHQIKTISQANKIDITENIGDWFKIHYNDINGWLKAGDLTLL